MVDKTTKADVLDRIINLSVDPGNSEESLALLRDLLFEDTNGGKLYKYRTFDDKGRNLSIIENQTIYCSKPSDFNDPFDCKIGVDLESIINAMCGKEIESLQDIMDKYILVVKGERTIEEYDYPESEAIKCLLDNETYNSLIKNNSLKSDDDISEFIRSNPRIIMDVMDPLLRISGIKEKYPLLDAQMEGLSRKALRNEAISSNLDMRGLTDVLKAQGINADVDQIGMAKLWAETLNDPKLVMDASQIDVLLSDLEKQYQSMMNEAFYIGSLAADYNNRLMWSHYANEHKGFCIEFDFSKGPDDLLPLPVIYSSKRIKMPIVPTKNPSQEQIRFMDSVFIKALLNKDSVWEYEREWRMIILTGKDRFVNMPPISCIYIGAQCSEENKAKIKSLAAQKDIPLKQMVLDRGEYELHAEIID